MLRAAGPPTHTRCVWGRTIYGVMFALGLVVAACCLPDDDGCCCSTMRIRLAVGSPTRPGFKYRSRCFSFFSGLGNSTPINQNTRLQASVGNITEAKAERLLNGQEKTVNERKGNRTFIVRVCVTAEMHITGETTLPLFPSKFRPARGPRATFIHATEKKEIGGSRDTQVREGRELW
jgi:hypothetical protein